MEQLSAHPGGAAMSRVYLVAVMTVAMLLMLNRELGLALLSLVLISEIANY